MGRLQLSIAIGDYDHTRDVTSGRVAVEGGELLRCCYSKKCRRLLAPEALFPKQTLTTVKI